jgi:hypothetical protein
MRPSKTWSHVKSRKVIVICPHFRVFYPSLHQPLAVGTRLVYLDSRKFRFRLVVGVKYFIFSTPFRPASGHSQFINHFGTRRYLFAVKLPEFPSKHSLPSSAKAELSRCITLLTPKRSWCRVYLRVGTTSSYLYCQINRSMCRPLCVY